MHIVQLVHTISYGDAISSEALYMHEVLNEEHDSTIYALNIDYRYKGEPGIMEFPKDGVLDLEPETRLILHYSLGSVLNTYYAASPCYKILIYHNVTPSKWFKQVNPRVYRDIEEGIKDLRDTVNVSNQVVADSWFNAKEVGCNLVLPVPLDTSRWAKSNPGIAASIDKEKKNIIHVGRLAPNKKIEDIIKTCYFLAKLREDIHLYIIGSDIDTEIYSFFLKRLVYDLSMTDNVTFTGKLADEEICSFYENADLYLCMSEHEGYCLPLLEAMHAGLPVLAYEQVAVKETLGDAGILVNKKDPMATACFINQLLDDSALLASMRDDGRRRLTEIFEPTAWKQQLLEILDMSKKVAAKV